MTNPEIPSEAVERAAKAIYETPHPSRRSAYDLAPADVQDRYRVQALNALTAAALPHLRVQETPTSEEEQGFVEMALQAVDAGNAGHWPTVAGYLADEVRRLRAAPHPRPVVDREALRSVLKRFHAAPANTSYDRRDLKRYRDDLTAAVLALLPTEDDTKALVETGTKLGGMIVAWIAAEKLARNLTSQPSGGPSEPLTAHTSHSGLPEGGEGL